jgi:hypothetical protein
MTKVLALLAAAAMAVVLVGAALANHSWGKYHWARTANPFTLKVGDNVNSSWDSYLNEAISDWSASTVLDLTKVAGGTSPSTCAPTAGRIEACNANYGSTGWLGVAQIWIQRGARGQVHITQGTTKLNDYYFNQAQYNTPAWRRLVTCQEIAHDFGLDHQDENFNNANLGSCMDYTSDPDGGPGGASSTDPSNEHPNQHDYDQLVSIYTHLDNSTTIASASADGPAANAPPFSQASRANGSHYADQLANGQTRYTFVFWTPAN